jgi:hypothetical protein
MLAGPAAADAVAGNGNSTLTGKCAKVVVVHRLTGPLFCSDKIVKFRIQNRRVGFTFLAQDGKGESGIVSFFGTSSTQSRRQHGAVVQSVNQVRFSSRGITDDLPALGQCVLSRQWSCPSSWCRFVM